MSSIRSIVRGTLASVALLALGTSARGMSVVQTIDADGSGDFTQIQSAVDAAANGDVLLIRGGTYAGFSVNAKSLWIARLGDEPVLVTSQVSVANLTPAQRVVLVGLDVRNGRPSLRAHENQGALHAIDCSFLGAPGNPQSFGNPPHEGGNGVELTSCLATVFTRCSISGGTGGSACWFASCIGARGGDGVLTDLAAPAFYDCTLVGGFGGNGEESGAGGPGGNGLRVTNRAVFVSGGELRGGAGGSVDDESAAVPGGDGGDGLVVEAGALAQVLATELESGEGGLSFFGPEGIDGEPSSGDGSIVDVPDYARSVAAQLIAPHATSINIEVRGAPGDRVFFGTSMSPGFASVPGILGIDLLAPNARFSRRSLGTIPPSGVLLASVPMPSIGSQTLRPLFGQASIIDRQGGLVLSGPVHVLVTNCALLAPDCNGNGAWDFCDLVSGESNDSNDNDLPDECEFTVVTHVDDDAPPGGNGSLAAPFRTMAEGIAASPDFQIVRVHDGLYTGPQNRNNNLSGRVLRVESANGPANCIIDCELAGIAFRVLSQSGSDANRISGFTIRNGDAADSGHVSWVGGGITAINSSPTIEDCIFEDCTGVGAGAIYAFSSLSSIERCTFVGNTSTNGAGALSYFADFGSAPSTARIHGCTFLENVSGNFGGAVRLTPSFDQGITMSHCIVLSNSAQSGGGIAMLQGSGVDQPVRIEHCLIAGNSATRGGGVSFSPFANQPLDDVLRNCTVVDNSATMHGGGVNGSARIENCAVWNNSAPSGAQLSVTSGYQLSVQRSDVMGADGAVAVIGTGSLTWGVGNLDQPPLFADADGADGVLATVRDNDYRLVAGSPCNDAGDNALVPLDVFDLDGDANTSESVPFDLDFLPRFVDDLGAPNTGAGAPPIVDIGAYERQP